MSQRRMYALTIVKHFNVFKHSRPGVLPSFEAEKRQPFRFQRMKKGFGDRMVVAVPFSAHALNDPVLGQDFPEILYFRFTLERSGSGL